MSVLSKKFAAARVLADANEAEAHERASLVEAIRMVEGAAFDFALTGRRQMAKADDVAAAAIERVNLARSHRLNSAEKMRHKARVWLGYETDCVAWARRARKELGT